MSATATPRHDSAVFSHGELASISPATNGVAVDGALTQPPAAESAGQAAQRAVETVLSLTERFTSADKHAVNLEFSIGGTDLHVRVELRANEVHTAFHTESPELRAALAREWQSVSTQAEDRATRFADPVFSSSSGGNHGMSSFSSDNAWQQQRDGAAQQEATGLLGQFSRGSDFDSDTDDASEAAVSFHPTAPLGTARQLHTFA